MASPVGHYVGSRRTHDALRDYHPLNTRKCSTTRDEALEGPLHDNWKTCKCDNCRAHRINGTKDHAPICSLADINRANRKAFGGTR